MSADRTEPVLTSPANPRIRAAAALRDRRHRAETGLTLVDGAREVRRALDSDVEVVEVFVCDPLLAGPDARASLDRLERAGTGSGGEVPIHRTTEAAFRKLAFGDRAEGLVAVVRAPAFALADLSLPDEPLVIVVDGVEKPGNLGAVLRSADGAGADALIAASPRTDLANPNVIRASAATWLSVPMAAAPSADVVAWLRAGGLRIVTARVDATTTYDQADLRGPLAIVVGAEDSGLGDAWTGAGIDAVHLPMHGTADSLNVSVAAAVLLYEARRQRDRYAREAD